MKAIVTGSNGFVGKNLVNFLLTKNIEVCCLTRQSSKTPDNPSNNLITYHCVDYFNKDTIYSKEIFKDVDYIFHVAGVTKSLSKNNFLRGNVIPTVNLLETIKQHDIKLKRFVLISSLAASGPASSLENPKKEEDQDNPIEYYGESKLRAENTAISFASDVPITIIRPSSVYGPYDKDFFSIFKMINNGVNIFYGNREKYISIIHVQDLVQGIFDAGISDNTKGKIYNLCNDSNTNWEELQNLIANGMNKNPIDIDFPEWFLNIGASLGDFFAYITKKPYLLNSQKIKLAKAKYWTCSNENAKKDFNFTPKVSLKDGLKETFEWYKTNNWL